LTDSRFNRNRLFDESKLPTRRQLRSDTSKHRSPIRKVIPDSRPIDASRKAAKIQRDASRSRKSRPTTPGSRSEAAVENWTDDIIQGQAMQRSTSKGSQTDLPAEDTAVLDEIIEETFDHATHRQQDQADEATSTDLMAGEEVRAIESPRNSPGADPRMVMPISAEDAAELPEALVQEIGSHDGHHKAATVHLPPKEVQERHLRESRRAREQRENLSINLPPRDVARAAEPLSSPGSTIDAHSATTPALHDASTDTSPDNESSRYEQERLENKDDEVETPIEFRKTPEEIAQKEEHDRILKAQMDISSAEILRRPTSADDQTDDQASSKGQPQQEDSPMVDAEGQESTDSLTKQASNVVRDIIEDEQDVAAAPTEDVAMADVGGPASMLKDPNGKQREIADSDAEGQTPTADAMDVDATIKDSFDSNATIETRPSATTVVPGSTEPVASGTDSKKATATPAESTPRRTPSTPVLPPSRIERMTTRVQSGAIRQKSVSDILSEIDRPNTTPNSDRNGPKGATESDSANSHSPSRSTTPQSPGRMRSLVEKAKERERSKLSTVVFANNKPRPSSSQNALVPSAGEAGRDTNGDYFMPLFLASASTDKRGVPSLDNLLQTAHKTITTSNAYIPINENQTSKVLRRIYNLQSSGKWSLRQPKRQLEPVRQTTHWDVLLQEAKWMRTDFREERKWKMAVAKNLAYACAEWVESGPEDRKLVQVKATPPKPPKPGPAEGGSSEDTEMVDESQHDLVSRTPDLVASGEFESLDDFDEEPRLNLVETVAPSAIFTLQDDEVVFGLRLSPTADKILDELPMYGAPLAVPSSDSLDPDRFWKRRALPLSKYVEGRMELKSQAPPRKKSRFEYDEDEDDDDHVVFGELGSKQPILPPEQTDVALFNPEHKHTRDRIHAGHQFRPPSEYPMPLQSFFECRTASQWTWAEDDELKAHVREYSYNWSLISSMLTSRSLFSSGAERRTPWECFERWISLEGLPADMQKTHYFRAYNSRLEAANRNVTAQAAQAPQQVNGQGVVQQQRRRSTISFRVERRRQQKHLTLVDAMRKLAKKRETSVQKQQHAAGLAAMRKAQEVPQPRVPLNTPQDFSRMKFEREERMKEQVQMYQQRQEAQRRVGNPASGSGFNEALSLCQIFHIVAYTSTNFSSRLKFKHD
jgi:chromatin modification-related protein VID21